LLIASGESAAAGQEEKMEGVGWILTIVLGGLAGWIAEKIMKSDMGLIANVILGIVGALVLNAILRWAGMAPTGGGGLIMQLIIAIIGACILIFGWRLIRGRR
jgi:uncharacterized membrane protein YeaQ/YmgE (transglycosylase-associated protein family)